MLLKSSFQWIGLGVETGRLGRFLGVWCKVYGVGAGRFGRFFGDG